MNEERFVDVTRGGYVESVHRVALCAVRADGTIIDEAGDIASPVFLRSAAKPFIAATAVQAGVVERFGLEPCEVAVMAASHFGEPYHVAAVESILRKIGLDASSLQCGVHAPYDERSAQALRDAGIAPSALHNNCSGKHAGILALCLAIGADTTTYLEADNPAQQRILAFCARMSDDDPATWPIGIDGCGIPVYATSLRSGALSFARLASLTGVSSADAQALRVVRDAMIAFPQYVAGTDQFDTLLMEAGRGVILSKGGAEGVHAVAALASGIGFVSKVIDGAGRARGPSSIAALRRLDIIDAAQERELARFARPAVYNRAGNVVGEIVSREGV